MKFNNGFLIVLKNPFARRPLKQNLLVLNFNISPFDGYEKGLIYWLNTTWQRKLLDIEPNYEFLILLCSLCNHSC